jgi:hypothetical protein
MPTITTPISRAKRATRNESSSIIGSVRDSGMVSKQWIKDKRDSDNQFSATNALSKLQSDVAKIRRVKAGGAPLSEQNPTILPLQVYQIGENALKFQIRTGLISVRSRYWKNGYKDASNNDSTYGGPNYNAYNDDLENVGNFETDCILIGDTWTALESGYQYSTLFSPITSKELVENSNTVTLSLDEDTLISGRDDTHNLLYYDSFLLPDMVGKEMGVDGENPTGIWVAFYAEIIDDVDFGVAINLWARCVKTQPSATTNFATMDYLFPNSLESFYGNTFIPLAVVGMDLQISLNPDTSTYVCNSVGFDHGFSQLQVGNLINRFPSYANANGGYLANPLIYRGKWTADSLSGQFFYPGDMVYDDSGASGYLTKTLDTGTGTFKYRGQYVFKANKPAFKTVAPNGDPTNWQYIGAVI